MIDWPNIKSVMKSVIADTAGVYESQVRWTDEPEGTSWSNEPCVYLRIANVSSIGQEEERRDDTAPIVVGDPIGVIISGQRRFTVSVRIESFTQDISDATNAMNIGDRIKVKLARDGITERYRGVFAIEDTLASIWTDYKNQGRQVGVFILDLLCLTVDNDIDDMLGSGDWIGRSLIKSDTLDDSDGSPLPEQIDLDVDKR